MALHDLVEYKLNTKQIIEYKVVIKNVLNMLKYSLYISEAEEMGGKLAGMIVHEILTKGYIEMSSVVMKIAASESDGDPKKLSYLAKVKVSFEKLVDGHYLERLPHLDMSAVKTVFNEDVGVKTTPLKLERMPKFVNSDEDKFSVPSIDGRRLILLLTLTCSNKAKFF